VACRLVDVDESHKILRPMTAPSRIFSARTRA